MPKAKEFVSAETVEMVLLLLGDLPAELTRQVIEGWSQDQREHVQKWAVLHHLKASDNIIQKRSIEKVYDACLHPYYTLMGHLVKPKEVRTGSTVFDI